LNFDRGIDFLESELRGGGAGVDGRLSNVTEQENVLSNWDRVVGCQVLYALTPPGKIFIADVKDVKG
jgi:hypothetical protein